MLPLDLELELELALALALELALALALALRPEPGQASSAPSARRQPRRQLRIKSYGICMTPQSPVVTGLLHWFDNTPAGYSWLTPVRLRCNPP